MTNGRLKVLQIGKFYPPARGGMETHLEALCRHVHKHADVHVLVANHGGPTSEEHLDGIRVTRAKTVFQAGAATS